MDRVVTCEDIPVFDAETNRPVVDPRTSEAFKAATRETLQWERPFICFSICGENPRGLHSIGCPVLRDKWRRGRKAA